MRTVAYKEDVASDRHRRQNVPRHILCFIFMVETHKIFPLQCVSSYAILNPLR